MKILTKTGYIDAVALFFELSDEQLEQVRNNKDYYQSREVLEVLNKSKGDNAHFFGISNTNGSLLNIQDFVKNLLTEYKSVSWWDKNIEEFKIVRR